LELLSKQRNNLATNLLITAGGFSVNREPSTMLLSACIDVSVFTKHLFMFLHGIYREMIKIACDFAIL